MAWRERDLQAYLARTGLRLVEAHPPKDLPVLSEAAFQAGILLVARTHGWLAWHAYSMKKSPAGFPDLVMAREALIFAELKLPGLSPTKAQEAWLDALRATQACEVYVWRPEDMDAIRTRLTRRLP